MTSTLLDQLDVYGPDRCASLTYDQARVYTAELAKTHYENFTVASSLLPRDLREHFRHVYSFCRWADDLGDETGDPQRSLDLLAWWQRELEACYAGHPRHPVFVALEPTIRQFDIPMKPFADLIDAFVQDQSVRRYDTWSQVLDYCTRSANPVGRLVLYLGGYRDEVRQQLSDATCTALQLANFWQDVRRDILERDRVYIPHDVASKHGLDITTLVKVVQVDGACGTEACCAVRAAVPPAGIKAITSAYRATVRELVQRTWPLFAQGRRLWPLLDRRLRLDVQLFTLGGEAILRKIEQIDYHTLVTRPTLGKAGKAGLLIRALAANMIPRRAPRRP